MQIKDVIDLGILLTLIGWIVAYIYAKRQERYERLWDNNISLLESITVPAKESSVITILIKVRLAYTLGKTSLDMFLSWIWKSQYLIIMEAIEKNILEKSEISEEDTKKLFDAIVAHFKSFFSIELEHLQKLFTSKSEEFRPKTQADYLSFIFLNEQPTKEMSEKVKIILTLCCEKIGEAVSTDDVKKKWKEKGLSTDLGSVVRYLKKLDGRNLSQRQLEKILRMGDKTFIVKNEHKSLLEETFKILNKTESEAL